MSRIKELREENKLNQKELASKLLLTNSTISDWERGRTEPNIDQLIQLSNIFNCSIDYIVGRESEDSIILINNELTEDENNLLDTVRQLNNVNKEMVYTFANLALANQNKAK